MPDDTGLTLLDSVVPPAVYPVPVISFVALYAVVVASSVALLVYRAILNVSPVAVIVPPEIEPVAALDDVICVPLSIEAITEPAATLVPDKVMPTAKPVKALTDVNVADEELDAVNVIVALKQWRPESTSVLNDVHMDVEMLMVVSLTRLL